MKQKNPLVSVIIVDYKKDNPYLIECLNAIQKQTYTNYEIILVHDLKINLDFPNLKIKSYGHYVGPAEKRDEGARISKGEILSFIDDDAYPHKDWLKNIVKNFKSNLVAGVGGPGITPPGVNWREEASGWASASPVGAGKYRYRFLPEKKRFVDDYPSMNLSVRKTDFFKVGGFDSSYWPGEDTKLCLDLTHKLGKKIIYEPTALVYHHRRPVWIPHLRQNGNFGLHRGFFARILPKTSFKLIYFLPSAMFLGLVFIVASSQVTSPPTILVRNLGIISFILYFLVLLFNAAWIFLVIYSKKQKADHQRIFIRSIVQALISIPVIFVTHLWYGIRFLQGLLLTDKLIR